MLSSTPPVLISLRSLVVLVLLDVVRFRPLWARRGHALLVGRGLSRVGVAHRAATPQALLTGSGRPSPFDAGAWGVHFSPNPTGARLPLRRRRPGPRRLPVLPSPP